MSTPKPKDATATDSAADKTVAAAAPNSAPTASPAAASVPAAPEGSKPDEGRSRPRYDGAKPPVFQNGGTYITYVD